MQDSKLKRDRLYPVLLPDVSTDAPTFDGTEVPVEYLFAYWDDRFALRAFLVDFPEVSSTQALAALRKRADAEFPVDSEDGRMGGMPVFRGTRVPIKFLFDSLKIGDSEEGFLSDYTSVDREDALRILEVASELVEIATYENVAPRLEYQDGVAWTASARLIPLRHKEQSLRGAFAVGIERERL